jgi:plasmid replication initiation protein
LKDREKLTRWLVPVDELQDILQVPKSLLRYSQFKQKILQVAERELIENCDIFFEMEEIKSGRKVTEILFRIKNNKPFLEEKAPKLFEDNLGVFDDYIGEKLITKTGIKKIAVVTKFSDYLSISFDDGSEAKVDNIANLKKSIELAKV